MRINIKAEKVSDRSALRAAMGQRTRAATIKDRRTPRGGARNKKASYLRGDY